jgi:hypothetical protein
MAWIAIAAAERSIRVRWRSSGKVFLQATESPKETTYVISKIAKEFLRCQAYDCSEHREFPCARQ